MKYLTLISELAKRGIQKTEVAKLLGIHWNSVMNKMNGKTAFSVDEAIKIHDAYFPDWKIEELFRREVMRNERDNQKKR